MNIDFKAVPYLFLHDLSVSTYVFSVIKYWLLINYVLMELKYNGYLENMDS